GSRCLLLHGVLKRRGRAARARVPPLAQPTQRRGLKSTVSGVCRLLAATARGRLPDRRAPEARERTLPSRRNGGRTLLRARRTNPCKNDPVQTWSTARHDPRKSSPAKQNKWLFA